MARKADTARFVKKGLQSASSLCDWNHRACAITSPPPVLREADKRSLVVRGNTLASPDRWTSFFRWVLVVPAGREMTSKMQRMSATSMNSSMGAVHFIPNPSFLSGGASAQPANSAGQINTSEGPSGKASLVPCSHGASGASAIRLSLVGLFSREWHSGNERCS